MRKGLFARFGGRTEEIEKLAPSVLPRADAAAAAAAEVAQVVRGIARQTLPRSRRKAAISLRVDPDVLDWFKAQGPGYQTRINAVLRAYKDAAS
ncbi:MAG: BrnA antitoxin family protein [Planctomycetaceae bacterium]